MLGVLVGVLSGIIVIYGYPRTYKYLEEEDNIPKYVGYTFLYAMLLNIVIMVFLKLCGVNV